VGGGIVQTSATVSMAGTATISGSATFKATTRNTVDVEAAPNPVKGLTIAAAVSVVESVADVVLLPTSRLTVGGDLTVKGETFDANRTWATSVAGLDGRVAVGAAVAVENGRTNALIDGFADVGGNIVVDAAQKNVPLTDDANLLGYLKAEGFSIERRLSGVRA
jgi:hypothetical protein